MSKKPRKRIAVGQLVYSTNKKQNYCLIGQIVLHFYRPLSYLRVRRTVPPTLDENQII
jgi:hypothetical protein